MSDSVSFSPTFSHDHILSKMDDPNILWGDLFIDNKSSPFAPVTLIISKPKDIQNHYPVFVRLQPSSKTLGIQWRMNKLAEWRSTNPNPLSWKTYEVNTARTMIDELRNSGWNVYAPTHPSFICSIERDENTMTMSSQYKQQQRQQRQQRQQQQWKYEEPDCPTMLCLNDIKLFFPVIWHKVESNCKTYSVELYHDKIRATAASRGIRPELLTNYLSSLLTITLSQSPAWIVVQPQMIGEHCRLVL